MRIHRRLLSITIVLLGFAAMDPWVRAQDRNASSAPEQTSAVQQVEAAVRANPRKAADIVMRTLAADQSASVKFAGQVVAASMRGLGPTVKRVPAGRIVMAAVKERSSAVLEIMRVAISHSGKAAHQEIVAAAASGVSATSDPYMPISVKEVEGSALGYERSESTGGGSNVQLVEGLSFNQGATLAEQILQVAFQTGSHESLIELSASMNAILQNGINVSNSQFNAQGQLSIHELGEAAPLGTPAPVSP
jgi:hypothetical protein